MVFTPYIIKHQRKYSYNYNKRRCNTVNSHINNIKLNHSNTLNSDNIIGNSYLTHINVQNKSSFNAIITLKKETDAESSICINN